MTPAGDPALEPGPTDADIIWLFETPARLGVRTHDDPHCAILVHGPFLYVTTSNGVDGTHRRTPCPDAPSLIVLDKATGRFIARDGEEIGKRNAHCMWSSPSYGEVNGKGLIFFGASDGVCYAFEALAPSALADPPGKLATAWKFDCDPTAPKEDVLKWMENRNEGPSLISGIPVFDGGRIYVTAGGDVWWGKLKCWIQCIDASGKGDITKTGELWKVQLDRHCMTTPAVKDGLVYTTDSGGKVRCIDAATGSEVWMHKTNGEMWSSPLVADGKVFVGTQRGDFWILAAGREKKVLASIDIGSAMAPTPVAANGVLYVATMNRLYAIAMKS